MEVLPQSILDQLAVNGRTNQDRIEAGEDTTDFEPVVKLFTPDGRATWLLSETDPEDADFSIATQESILTAANSVDDTMTVMLGGIAVISLLVGGIGVMNIMLVSVSERVREIGLRKALGGRPRSIRRQFLVEASILGAAGGALGVLVGVAGSVVLPALTDARVELSLWVAAMAIVVAVAIGVAFGVYPAGRAARLAPIDALRND